MMIASAVIGSLGSFFGIYLAWAIDLPAGATIVLLLTACFLVAWALSPLLHSRRDAASTSQSHTSKETLSA